MFRYNYNLKALELSSVKSTFKNQGEAPFHSVCMQVMLAKCLLHANS